MTKSLNVFYNYFEKDVYCDKKGMILMGRFLAVGIPAKINIVGKIRNYKKGNWKIYRFEFV